MDYGSPENIKRRYEAMSDNRLREFASDRNELTELGQELLRQEFERRGIAMADPAPEVIPEVEDKLRKLVTIRSYRDLSEANVARAVVESAGIYCFLRDENTVRTDWMWSNLIGGIRLQVAEEDASEANEVLSQLIPESFELEDGQIYKQPVCPKCGSVDCDAHSTIPKRGLVFSLAVAIGLPLTLPAMVVRADDSWKCNRCGCVWSDDEADDPAKA